MSGYVVAPAAQEDLLVIWHYYAEQVGNPDLADRMVGEIVSGFRQVAATPGMDHLRRDLSEEPLRFWNVRRYLIAYRPEVRPLEIVRVIHGARDMQAILGT